MVNLNRLVFCLFVFFEIPERERERELKKNFVIKFLNLFEVIHPTNGYTPIGIMYNRTIFTNSILK